MVSRYGVSKEGAVGVVGVGPMSHCWLPHCAGPPPQNPQNHNHHIHQTHQPPSSPSPRLTHQLNHHQLTVNVSHQQQQQNQHKQAPPQFRVIQTNARTEFHASSQTYGAQPGAQVGGGGGSVGVQGGRPPPLGNIQTIGQSTTVISTGGPSGGQVTLQTSTQRVSTQQSQGPSAATPPVHNQSPQEMGKQGHLQTQPSQLSQAYVTTQTRPAVSQGYFPTSRPQHPRGPSHRGAHGGSGSQVLSMPLGGGGQPTMYPHQQMAVQSQVYLSNPMSTIHPSPHQQSVNPWGNHMSLQPYATGAPQRTQTHQPSFYPFPQHPIIPGTPYQYGSSASHQNYFFPQQMNLRSNANAVGGAMQHVGGPLAGAQAAAVVSQGTLQQSTQQSQFIPSIAMQIPQTDIYSGHNGGAANLVNSGSKNKKVKRPHALDIVNPETHACVDVFSDDEGTQSSDSSNRETPRPQNGSAEVIIATFAAQVAKAATEGSDSNLTASDASSVSHNVIQNLGNVQTNSNNELINDRNSGSSTPILNELVANETTNVSLKQTLAGSSVSPTPDKVAPSIDFPVPLADVIFPLKEFKPKNVAKTVVNEEAKVLLTPSSQDGIQLIEQNKVSTGNESNTRDSQQRQSSVVVASGPPVSHVSPGATTTTTTTTNTTTTTTTTIPTSNVADVSKISTVLGANAIPARDPFPTLSAKAQSSSPPRRKTQNHQPSNQQMSNLERTNTAKDQKEKNSREKSLAPKGASTTVPTVGAHKSQAGEQPKPNGDAVVVDKLETDQETSKNEIQQKLSNSKAKQKTKGKMKHDINRRGAEKEGTDMDAFVNPVPQVKQQQLDAKEPIRGTDNQETVPDVKDSQESKNEPLDFSLTGTARAAELPQTPVAIETLEDEPSDEAQNIIPETESVHLEEESSLEPIPIENEEPLANVPVKSTDDVVDHARIGQEPETIEASIKEIPKTSPVLIEQEKEQQQPPSITTVSEIPDEQDNNKEVNLDDDLPKTADLGKSSAPTTLRYNYKKDQWSPNNQTGKKVYDREFLMTVQDDPQCRIKPNLPDLDVVMMSCAKPRSMLMRPNKDVMVCPGGLPFPSFMRSADTMSHPRMVPKRGSLPGNPRPTTYVSISLNKDIQLNKSENAWKPSRLKDGSNAEEEIKTELLYKKVRSVLNKLTPQKFHTLVDQVRKLHIDSQERLQGVINLVFDKAVDEPSFSVAYALMCKELGFMAANDPSSTKDVQEKGEATFKKLIISRCQMEFEKNPADEFQRTKMLKEIEDCTDPDKKKDLQSALEEEERKIRIKSVGNIRFIGELYKQQILTTKIMNRCIKHLLNQKDEDNLECLCKLLSTIGGDLETKNETPGEMAEYFKKMNDIVHKKDENQISSRIRFMLQDVIDLRSNNWKPRRGEVNPKTIDEIKKEAETERLESQFNAQIGTPRKDDRNMDKKRRTGAWSSSEDGWMQSTARTRQTPYSVEPSKLKTKPPETEDMTLGSRTAYMWSNLGSGGNNAKSMNRFTCLDNVSSFEQDNRVPLQLSGSRSTGPRDYGRSSDYKHSYDGRSSHNGGSSKLPTGPSSSNRESLLMENSRSQSASNPLQPFSKSASLTMPRTNRPPSMTSEEFFMQSLNPILGTYLLGGNIEEAVCHVRKSFEPAVLGKFVGEIMSRSFEKTSKERGLISKLFSHLIGGKILSPQHLNDGYNQNIDIVNDLIIDIPKIWTYLAEILVAIIGDEVMQLSDLGPCWALLKTKGDVGKLLGELLKKLAQEKGERWVVDKWERSDLQWNKLLDLEVEKVEDIINEHKIQFLTSDRSNVKTCSDHQLSFQEIQDQLLEHMKKDGFDIGDWIMTAVGDRVKEPMFVRHLTSAILKTCVVESKDKWMFEKERFGKLKMLIPRFTDTDETRELQCLYAIQTYMNEIQHPPGILNALMMDLYSDNLITVEAFLNWKDGSTECDGWGVAMKSLNTFFHVVEADRGDSSTDEEASTSVAPKC